MAPALIRFMMMICLASPSLAARYPGNMSSMAPVAAATTPVAPDAAALRTHTHEAGRDEALTLVIMDYSRKRWDMLSSVLKHYQSFHRSLIAEIVVVWNNASDLSSPQELRQMNRKNEIPIRVEVFGNNSMNNRFAVGEKIRTRGVVVQDNDVYMDQSDLSCLVGAWRQQPDRLFGAWSHRRAYEKVGEHLVYQFHPAGDEFSIILPHPWVVKTDYLRLYLKNKPMLELVDNMMNCDDIYFNAVVADETGAPPIAFKVEVHERLDLYHEGLSTIWPQADWTADRNQCLDRVNAYFKASQVGVHTDTFISGPGPAQCS